MNRFACCLVILSVLAAEQSTRGADFWGTLGRELECMRSAVVPGCCANDYCRKPQPCIPCAPLPTACDDYCRKPTPYIPCFHYQWCADDYCRKPLPQLCCPVNGSCCP
ncbi:MAG: hypothetical protein GX575_16290 [Candidatus Anammoximicrobium sp.]|nr:hypothetical protein [Candidatus Anammoximicrobium sp.]